MIVDPIVSHILSSFIPTITQFRNGWAVAVGSAVIVGWVGFSTGIEFVDGVIGFISFLGWSDPLHAHLRARVLNLILQVYPAYFTHPPSISKKSLAQRSRKALLRLRRLWKL